MQSRIIKGTYGTEFDVNATAKKVRTGVRGRPPKNVDAIQFASNMQINDLFGRVPNRAPKGTPGRVIIGRASVNAVYENDNTDE